ncbi:Disulfide bond formation protein D precursor [Paraliobacillus sp. PM-2]|uniref:DsbA family protein n=1 Tax=Paraliobacillus sp. PM-2 TaxID=1462524 RepID=UPI00061BD471|nr:thioredoxin domain-containing protein [Paraliobacillus sp. PM-2]CQR48447.1 Disulfide bond formation protein D precursor [Paraliobacillus sp. PM-2]
MKRKSLIILGSIFAVVVIGMAVLLGLSTTTDTTDANDTTNTSDNDTTKSLDKAVDTTPIDGQKTVYLGDKEAENEIFLAFDYSCPACKQWMNEILPELEQEYIENGKAKFRMQSMVYLNDASLRLSKFDQNLIYYNKEQYYEIAERIMSDSQSQQEAWGTEQYIKDIISEYNLDQDTMLQDNELDAINVTRKYTRDLGIESVPSIFVNGVQVEEPFNIEEIKTLLNE